MRKYLLLSLLCIVSVCAKAQIEHPVKWSYASKRINKTEALVFLKASIADGWHIYSTHQKDGGPVKTSIAFNKSPAYQLLGEITEPKPLSKFEKSFGIGVTYFENSAVFTQKIKLLKGQATVSGTLTYMSCNDQKCLPPESVSFNIPVQ
jgi:DsbC/DsbD-like thiol-disulfide interchange protein